MGSSENKINQIKSKHIKKKTSFLPSKSPKLTYSLANFQSINNSLGKDLNKDCKK